MQVIDDQSAVDEYQVATTQTSIEQRKDEIALRLQGIIDARVHKRADLERDWLKATRQYNGEYDPEILNALKGSKAFYNGTRKLCNYAEARLCEMVLPTNDRNWDIDPTPIPELPADLVALADQLVAEAKKRAISMRKLIDDQMGECDYNNTVRRLIHDGVVLGTGIIKSPVVRNQVSSRFAKRDLGMGMTEYATEIENKIVPAVEAVSPWDFYPDPDAVDMFGSENTFERHRMTAKQLRSLAKTPGFDPDAVREVVKHESGYRPDGYEAAVLNPLGDGDQDKRYHLWEFHGSLPYEDCCALLGNGEEIDPLESAQMHVWFCDGKLIKASMSLVDEGEQLYDVFCWEPNDHSIFGFGVPHRIEHSQRIANSTLRMLMDNGAYSVLPQYVIDNSRLEPADGKYEVEPGKVWLKKGGGGDDKLLQAIETPVRIDILLNLFERAVKMMEEESGIYMLQQSGQEPAVTQTATGTSMLLNSASSPLRRLVREIDRVNKFALQSIYRWNMQFHDDDEIKGDYNIRVTGSSSLMVREQQTAGMLQIIKAAEASPVLSKITKIPEAWRRTIQSMQINADDLVKTDEELAQEESGQQPPPNPEILKLQIDQGKLQLATQELQFKAQDAERKHQLDLMALQGEKRKVDVLEFDSRNDLMRTQIQAQRESERIQSNQQMMLARIAADTQKTVDQIRANLGIERMKLDNKNQLFNAEATLKMRAGSGI